jgi:hypothetical protein
MMLGLVEDVRVALGFETVSFLPLNPSRGRE